MPSADTDSSTAHTVHVSVGDTSEAADACGAQCSRLGCRLLRPTSCSCVPDDGRGHHVHPNCNSARGTAARAGAAAARRHDAILTCRATLPTEAATQLTAIAHHVCRKRARAADTRTGAVATGGQGPPSHAHADSRPSTTAVFVPFDVRRGGAAARSPFQRPAPAPAGAMATQLSAQPARSLRAGSSSFCSGGARLPCARAARVAAPRASRRAVGVTAKVQGNIKKARDTSSRRAACTAQHAPRAHDRSGT